MSTRPALLLLASLLAAPCALAADYLPDPELVGRSIAQQPEVRAAAARVQAARAQARMQALGSHEFEVSGVQQQRKVEDMPGIDNFREWELQVSRRLRPPGKARLDNAIGQYGLEAADLRQQDAQHQAARHLAQRWMGWLRAAAVAEEAERQYASLLRERDALRRRVELGDAAHKDLDLMEVELAQAEAQRLAADSTQHSAHRAMAIDFPLLPLPEYPPTLPEPDALQESDAVWIGRIVDRSHEIGALAKVAEQQEAVAARARADRFPDPSLGLRVLNDRGGAESVIGVVLSVPIGGRYRRAVGAAEAAEASARHDDTAIMAREIAREAELAVREAGSTVMQWRAMLAARTASTAASTRQRRGWELGELGLSEWLLAERNSRQISLAEIMARADAVEARLRVLVDSHELWHTVN